MTVPRLNRALVLESPTRQPDGAGGYVENWTPLGTHWAEVQPRTGREGAATGAALAAVSFRITIRGAPIGSSARPLPEQRFRDGARLFLIRAVTERDVEGRYLVCFADEEVAV